MARKQTAGRIVYRTTFIPNPDYRPRERELFSEELLSEIRRWNVPEQRVVWFDGSRSRVEETNADYGVRSGAFELRSAGRGTVTYCKKLRLFRFCVERPIEIPVGGPPAHFAPLDETATIAGLPCRKGEYLSSQRLHVWYTEELEVDDPTGAVLRLDGVPGLILQTAEIAESERIDAVKQVTVIELSSEPPPPEIFSRPADYRTVRDIDAARAEDRQMIDEAAGTTTGEPGKFAGNWLFDRAPDRILVEITPQLRFRTTVAGHTTEERASVKGEWLVVDDPPNDRYYRLSDDGRKLIEIDRELFTFNRQP